MKQVQTLQILVGITVAMLFSACDTLGQFGGTLQGVVSDSTGAPLAGVSITAGSASTLSDASGNYSLRVSPVANLKVAASKASLLSTFDIVSIASGQTMPVNFTLRPVGQTNTLSNMKTTLTTATDPRGAEVKLPANSIVDSTGAAVDNATVSVSTALPSDFNYAENFPGLFVGTQAGADKAIESFGFVSVDIVSSDGKKCNLRTDVPVEADLAIPVAPTADPATPTIDLWSLNETTGKWMYEGVATRDASASPVVYRAKVKHFSTYNLDRPIQEPLPFTITVKNAAGAMVSGASVTITSTNATGGGVWEGRATTAQNGTVYFAQVPQGSVSVSALLGNQMGKGYAYDVTGGQATMTIVLYNMVTKTVTVVYNDNGTEKVAPNVSIKAEQVGGNTPAAITDANGKVTLRLQENATFYYFWATTTIAGQQYSVNINATSIATIPNKWVMTKVVITQEQKLN